MSWIPITRGLTMASLCWLAASGTSHELPAQTPQLAPPQYGISDGSPSGFNDAGPQPNLAPPPLTAQLANEDREYLRLLNQQSPNTTASNSIVPVKPASMDPAPVTHPVGMNQVNVATRPEAINATPVVQSNYQLPAATSGAATTTPQNSTTGPAANLQATYTTPASNAPAPSTPRPLPLSGNKPIPLAGPNTKAPAASNSWGSFGTMLGSLAIVLGLFVVTIKLLRRGMPGVKQRLGRDIVEVLGQTPLAPRQTLQVIRFGNKILLVAMSPDGCDTLTEITDPLEVDRLAGMCQQNQANSSTKIFGEMFRQVTSIRPAVTEALAEAPAASSTLDNVRARLRGSSIAKEVQHG